MSLAVNKMTLAEFAPYAEDSQYELVDGELRKRETSNQTVRVGGVLCTLLWQFAWKSRSGEPMSDGTAYQCFPDDPDLVRKPDVSWFSADRISSESLDSRYIEAAPDLIVEVVSPNDNAYEVEQKVEQFLSAGTKEAWVVFPHIRKVERRLADGTARWYGADDEFDATPVIPGFRWKLADVLEKALLQKP
jgi:Uma2 family endonuclease